LKQMIKRPQSRLILDQSFIAHHPVRPKPLHFLSILRPALLARLTWPLSAGRIQDLSYQLVDHCH
jgi:hypothetical protein